MATAGATIRRSGGLGSLSVGLYLLITAFILFTYFRAWVELLPLRDRIMMGYGAVMAPRFSLGGLFIACVVVVLVLLFYKHILRWLNVVPAGLRGMVLPIPFYYFATNDLNLTAVLVALGAVMWLLYHPLGAVLLALLKPVPPKILEPLARFWAAILYTALVTRAVLPVIIAIAVLVGYHFLDQAVEWLFAPVWNWHRALPTLPWMMLFIGRLAVGATAPFLFSQYYAWVSGGISGSWYYNDSLMPLFTVLAGLAGYFLLRMPRGTGTAQQSG